MPFQSRDINPLAQLVELKSVVRENSDAPGLHSLEVELGIFEDEVVIDKATIEVSLKQAVLSLDLEGLEVVEASKYGIDHVPSKVSVKTSSEALVQTSIERTKAFEVVASGELSTLVQSAKASGSKSAKETNSALASLKENREVISDFYPVKAVGDDNWRIANLDGSNLDQTFLNYDKLCGLRAKSVRANRIATSLTVSARSRHVAASVVKDEKLFKRVGTNREKVIGILVSKGLHEATSEANYEGMITFSVSMVEYEG